MILLLDKVLGVLGKVINRLNELSNKIDNDSRIELLGIKDRCNSLSRVLVSIRRNIALSINRDKYYLDITKILDGYYPFTIRVNKDRYFNWDNELFRRVLNSEIDSRSNISNKMYLVFESIEVLKEVLRHVVVEKVIDNTK